MRPILFLADAAQVADGKINALGIGWERVLLGMSPWAIAGYIDVPWVDSNRDHTLKIELVTADGAVVCVPTPMGDQPFTIEMGFQVGRPPGVTQGSSLRVPIAISLSPLPVPVGRYEFRVSIDDKLLAESTMPMEVMGAVPGTGRP